MQLASGGEVAVQAVECGIGVSAPALVGAISGQADAKYAYCGSSGDHVVAKRYVIWLGMMRVALYYVAR